MSEPNQVIDPKTILLCSELRKLRTYAQNMHAAIRRTASSTAKILPCMCTGATNGEVSELVQFGTVDYPEEKRYLLKIQLKVQCI